MVQSKTLPCPVWAAWCCMTYAKFWRQNILNSSLSLFSQPGPSWCQWCTQGASYPAANQRRVLVTLTNERPPSAGYFPSLFTQHWRPKRGAVTVKNTGNSLVIDDNIAISGRCVIARLPLLPYLCRRIKIYLACSSKIPYKPNQHLWRFIDTKLAKNVPIFDTSLRHE